ncbi:MAG: LytTR family transcriptional regulator DNA-binding domain-containing protein [Colwellia sp.]|nr:LytTR family transcriptional regulator DNA-binding domain-containing protein [Colwellia sp.]
MNPEINQTEKHIAKKQLGREFWTFHLIFWSIITFIMLLSGLSQFMSFEVAIVRNVLYGSLGFFSTLLLLPLFDKHRLQGTLKILTLCVTSSYVIGALVTLLINAVNSAQSGFILWDQPLTSWFGGSLNFALVTLVWCSFYLAFKHGLRFVGGEEAQKAAQAIASISSLSNYPEFIALERNKKIFLLPIDSISTVQGAGDYVELSTDEGSFLKRESLGNMVKILDPKIFQRVHRSAIVNLHVIRELEPKGKGDYTLVLKSGSKIAASRSYMKDFKSRFSGEI